MNKVYNKLVRDNIPEIIKNNGEIPEIEILDDETYYKKLQEKLVEEVNEYIVDDDTNEIADVLEVIYAILKFKNVNINEIEDIRKNKLLKRGGFNKKIFLKQTTEK